MNWSIWKRLRKPRSIEIMAPNEVYTLLLDELPLPNWLEKILGEAAGALSWGFGSDNDKDYSGTYCYCVLENGAGRTGLLHLSADIADKAYSQIANLAAHMLSFSKADRLFIFSDIRAISPERLAQKDTWFPRGNVIFCVGPQLKRLESTLDPGERREIVRTWFDLPQPMLAATSAPNSRRRLGFQLCSSLPSEIPL